MTDISAGTAREGAQTGKGLKALIQSLGPGMIMASAAVGGSHLVASTKAGAFYGWQLAILILLVNLFKYPFFRAGVTYTMATGATLQRGYADMGKGYLYLFAALNLIAGIVNSSALLMFTASLLGYFLPFELSMPVLCGAVAAGCAVTLIAGHYKVLDRLSKFIMASLTVATVIAVAVAAGQGAAAPADYVSPSPWTLASLAFIIAMMGWMPAPIEISCLNSLWLQRQRQERKVTVKSALLDFNVGYIGTAALALVFLSLGALVLHGSGVELSQSGVGYTHQLVGMYSQTIGAWSEKLIAFIAFLCMLGSTITVIDGYSRADAEAQTLLFGKGKEPSCRLHHTWIIINSLGAMSIILFFIGALMQMLNFAMILAFLTTPVFAWLNYRLVNILNQDKNLDPQLRASQGLIWLSRAGLVYLFGFMALFVVWKLFL